MDLGRSLPRHRRPQTDSYQTAFDLWSSEPGFGLLPLRATASGHWPPELGDDGRRSGGRSSSSSSNSVELVRRAGPLMSATHCSLSVNKTVAPSNHCRSPMLHVYITRSTAVAASADDEGAGRRRLGNAYSQQYGQRDDWKPSGAATWQRNEPTASVQINWAAFDTILSTLSHFSALGI